MIIPRWILLQTWNASEKCCRENRNTHFMSSNPPPPPKIMPFVTCITRQVIYVHRNINKPSLNHICVGRIVRFRPTCSECVFVALVIRHAMHTRLIMSSCGLSGCTIFTSLYPINGTIYGKCVQNIESLFLSFCTNFARNIFDLRRTERSIIIDVQRSSMQNTSCFSGFDENWIFSTDIRKRVKYQIL